MTPYQVTHLVRRGDLVPAGRNVCRSPSWPDSELGRCARMCLGRPGVVIAGPTAGRVWGLRKMSADQRMHVLMQPHANSVARTKSIVARRTSTLREQDIEDRDDGFE